MQPMIEKVGLHLAWMAAGIYETRQSHIGIIRATDRN